MQKNKLSSFFNTVSIWSTLLVPIVALLGFLPIAPLGVDGTKVVVGGALIVCALISYVISSCINKVFLLPPTLIVVATGIFAAAYIVSSFFTGMPMQSLFGLGIEMWTGTTLTLLLMYFLLVSIHAQNVSVRQMFIRIMLGAAATAVLFQVLRFLTLGVVKFSFFQNDIVFNTVGRWFDFGFVALMLTLATLIYVVTKSSTVIRRVFAWIAVVIGLIGVFMVSSLTLSLLLALGAFAVYSFAAKITDESRHDKVAKIITIVIGSVAGIVFAFQLFTAQSPFFFQGAQVPNLAVTRYDIFYRDYPVTFLGETLTVLKPVLRENSIFGFGLNRFDEAWAQYKSTNMNTVQNMQWWTTDFSYGFGLPLTMLGMTGVLGLLGLITFLGSIIYTLWVSRMNMQSTRQYSITLLSILGLGYILVHTPSAGLLLTLLTLWGIAISYAGSDILSIGNNRNSILGLVFVFLITLVPVYGFASRTIHLTQGMLALRTVDTSEGVENAIRKIEIISKTNTHSTFYQSLATLEQIKAGQIANKIRTEEKTLSEADIKNLTKNLTQSYENADRALRNAIILSPHNYNVYIQQAQFLGGLAQLSAESEAEKSARNNRYEEAKRDLEKARTLAPQNPNIDVLQAQLEIQQQSFKEIQKRDYKEAQTLLLKAIEKRPAFTDPALLLAQLYAQQNNLADARTAAQYAVRTDTSNPQALYIYGQLEKEAKNYVTAAQAFERIVALQGNSASPEIARLLADTYVAAGAISQAKAIYEQILKADPKNVEVEQILVQMQATTVKPESIPEKKAVTPAPKKR